MEKYSSSERINHNYQSIAYLQEIHSSWEPEIRTTACQAPNWPLAFDSQLAELLKLCQPLLEIGEVGRPLYQHEFNKRRLYAYTHE